MDCECNLGHGLDISIKRFDDVGNLSSYLTEHAKWALEEIGSYPYEEFDFRGNPWLAIGLLDSKIVSYLVYDVCGFTHYWHHVLTQKEYRGHGLRYGRQIGCHLLATINGKAEVLALVHSKNEEGLKFVQGLEFKLNSGWWERPKGSTLPNICGSLKGI